MRWTPLQAIRYLVYNRQPPQSACTTKCSRYTQAQELKKKTTINNQYLSTKKKRTLSEDIQSEFHNQQKHTTTRCKSEYLGYKTFV
jgi:hypothetical protein